MVTSSSSPCSRIWDRVCQMIERPDLIEDPHFTDPKNFSGNPEVKASSTQSCWSGCYSRTKREVMRSAQAAGLSLRCDQHHGRRLHGPAPRGARLLRRDGPPVRRAAEVPGRAVQAERDALASGPRATARRAHRRGATRSSATATRTSRGCASRERSDASQLPLEGIRVIDM